MAPKRTRRRHRIVKNTIPPPEDPKVSNNSQPKQNDNGVIKIPDSEGSIVRIETQTLNDEDLLEVVASPARKETGVTVSDLAGEGSFEIRQNQANQQSARKVTETTVTDLEKKVQF